MKLLAEVDTLTVESMSRANCGFFCIHYKKVQKCTESLYSMQKYGEHPLFDIKIFE